MREIPNCGEPVIKERKREMKEKESKNSMNHYFIYNSISPTVEHSSLYPHLQEEEKVAGYSLVEGVCVGSGEGRGDRGEL